MCTKAHVDDATSNAPTWKDAKSRTKPFEGSDDGKSEPEDGNDLREQMKKIENQADQSQADPNARSKAQSTPMKIFETKPEAHASDVPAASSAMKSLESIYTTKQSNRQKSQGLQQSV